MGYIAPGVFDGGNASFSVSTSKKKKEKDRKWEARCPVLVVLTLLKSRYIFFRYGPRIRARSRFTKG
jgi:hypothetical protein